MPGITSTGLASGLNTDAIIEHLLELENSRIAQLTDRQASSTTRLSAWTGLQTAVFSLRTAALALNASSTWHGVSTSSSDDTVLDVSGTSDQAVGNYEFTVRRLASAHRIASQGFADTGTTNTGTGTLAVSVGGSTYSIAIDAAHATLAGIEEAVNAADIGVHASIVDTGSGANPYRLVLSSEHTGLANMITVNGSLSGGTAPSFATTRGDAVTGTWTGTSSPVAGGTYGGTTNRTLTFTAATSGTVGATPLIVNWTDDLGGSGSITLGAGYVPGTAVDVDDGVTVAFGAGDLVAGDDFSIDVTAPTIQAAADAQIEIGSSGTGGVPITVTRSDNVVTDLVQGLTLTLRSASATPVSVTVNRDTAAVRDALQTFVDSYNSLADLASSSSSYDAASQQAAPLLGDSGLITLRSEIRSVMTGVVPEVGGDLRSLSALGITSISNGQLSIDFGTLDDHLDDDFADVERLLRSTGRSSDSDIEYRTGGTSTQASGSGYGVHITRAAEQATYSGGSMTAPTPGSPIVITSANDRLQLNVDRVASGVITLNHGSYTSGEALAAELQTRINADSSLGNAEVSVRWMDDGGGSGHLQVASNRYGSSSGIWWQETSNSAYATLGISGGASVYGVDVAGTIGGEAATGDGRILTANDGNTHTAGLSVVVNLTAAQLAAQGADQGAITFTRGIGDLVADWADDVTDNQNGLISRREAAIQSQIDGFSAQADRVRAETATRRQNLVDMFARMETTLAQLQNQGSFLTAALSNLSGTR